MNLDIRKAPICRCVVLLVLSLRHKCRVDPTPDIVRALNQRRAVFRLQRVIDLASLMPDPSDSELELLSNAFNIMRYKVDLNDKQAAVCPLSR